MASAGTFYHFEASPLTQVQADLIFVQSARHSDGAAKENSCGIQRPDAGSRARRRNSMNLDSFWRALDAIGAQCMSDHAAPLQAICEKVILPLSESVAQKQGEDIPCAVSFVSSLDGSALLETCRTGLERVFFQFAFGQGSKRHWNSESMLSFAEEFGISEVGPLLLNRIIRDCAHHESCGGSSTEGRLSYIGFQLALVLLAQKVHGSRCWSVMERFVAMLHRLNAARSRPCRELIPNLPSPPSRSFCYDQSKTDLSWFGLTNVAFAMEDEGDSFLA